MAQWEYLQVIYEDGSMSDSTGRYWESNKVKATVGVQKRGGVEKAIEWLWNSASALSDLGAEGWELAGVIPGGLGGAKLRYSTSDYVLDADLLIFKRPKP